MGQNAQEYFDKAVIMGKNGDKYGAIANFTKAINLRPDISTFYFNRATFKAEVGDNLGAVTDYLECFELDEQRWGTNATFWYNLGIASNKIDKNMESYTFLTKAIALEPKNDKYYFARASSLSKQKKISESILDLDIAIKINPNEASYYFNRGLYYLDLNKKTEGCFNLSKAGERGLIQAYDAIKKKCY